jgi:molybdopterin biosynthesis enzyme
MATQKTQATGAASVAKKDAVTIAVTACTSINYDGVAIREGEKFDVREENLAQLLAGNAVTVDEAQA